MQKVVFPYPGFHNPQYVAINDAEIDPGFFVDYYSWYVDCNDGLENVRDTSGKSAAVKMTEVCWEYLSTGEIPVQLRYPMFTSSLHTDDEIKDALDEVNSIFIPLKINLRLILVSTFERSAQLKPWFSWDLHLINI